MHEGAGFFQMILKKYEKNSAAGVYGMLQKTTCRRMPLPGGKDIVFAASLLLSGCGQGPLEQDAEMETERETDIACQL